MPPKEQTRVAEYNYYENFPKKGEIVLDEPDVTIKNWDGPLQEVLTDLGVEFDVERPEYSGDDDPEVKQMVKDFRDNREWLSGYPASRLKVKTLTRDGREVHEERRREVEEFLRGLGIDFELECTTIHSRQACRILVPKGVE